MTTTIRLSTTYFKALNAHHILCLPTTRYVRSINTIIEYSKKNQKEYELKTEKR